MTISANIIPCDSSRAPLPRCSLPSPQAIAATTATLQWPPLFLYPTYVFLPLTYLSHLHPPPPINPLPSSPRALPHPQPSPPPHSAKPPTFSLHTHPTHLSHLREKLFLLWGDLDERKTQILLAKNALAQNPQTSLANPNPQKPLDESQAPHANLERTNSGRIKEVWEVPKARPFQCCVKEYGVKGKGGWERRWRMFGTTIS